MHADDPRSEEPARSRTARQRRLRLTRLVIVLMFAVLWLAVLIRDLATGTSSLLIGLIPILAVWPVVGITRRMWPIFDDLDPELRPQPDRSEP